MGKLLVAKKDISAGLHQVVCRIRAIILLKIYTSFQPSYLNPVSSIGDAG
jgi:hypothetical protein